MRHSIYGLSHGTLAAELGPRDPELLRPLRDDLHAWADDQDVLPASWRDAIAEYKRDRYAPGWW